MGRKPGTKNKIKKPKGKITITQQGPVDVIEESFIKNETPIELFTKALDTLNQSLDFLKQSFDANAKNLVTVAVNADNLHKRLSAVESFLTQNMGATKNSTPQQPLKQEVTGQMSNATAKTVPQAVNGNGVKETSTADLLNDI